MTILVTGSEGSIGQRLTQTLRDLGHEVISADYYLKDQTGYEKVDITRFEEVIRVFRGPYQIDLVLHLAGEVGRLNGEMFPQRMVHVNELGTLNLIQACVEHGTRLIFFSTSEIYGNLGSDIKMSEHLAEEIPLEQTNIYAISKFNAERYIKHFHRNYGLKAAIIRPFMIYGPGEYPGKYRSAISNFIFRALTGQELEVHRGTRRAWTYIDDFIQGVLLILEKHDFDHLEAYNIGSDEEHDTEEVAKIILEETKSSSQIRIIDPPKQFFTPVKIGDFQKIHSLGFRCRFSLREGIRSTITWQRKVLNLV
jgi:nucleoside-diphosphate-sugar epimerase